MSKELNAVANVPMEFELGGRRVKARRVGMDTMFAAAEATVLSRCMQQMRTFADETYGSATDKMAFLAKAVNELPSGVELSRLTADYSRSPEGVKAVVVAALVRDQPDIANELDFAKLIAEDDIGVMLLVQWLFGTGKKKAGGDGEGAPLFAAASGAKTGA